MHPSQVTFLRKTRGSRLNIFAPISDLSSLAKTGSEGKLLEAGPRNDIAVSGGQVLGDEWTTHVVEVCLSPKINLGQYFLSSNRIEAESSFVPSMLSGTVSYNICLTNSAYTAPFSSLINGSMNRTPLKLASGALSIFAMYQAPRSMPLANPLLMLLMQLSAESNLIILSH